MGVGVAFGLGIGRANNQLGPHDGHFDRVSHGQFIDAIPQLKRHAQPPPKRPVAIRADLAKW
jgi:hypothetical protein